MVVELSVNSPYTCLDAIGDEEQNDSLYFSLVCRSKRCSGRERERAPWQAYMASTSGHDDDDEAMLITLYVEALQALRMTGPDSNLVSAHLVNIASAARARAPQVAYLL